MRGNEGVKQLRHRCEARQPLIESEPTALAARVAQSEETRFGTARTAPIGGDVLHGTLELGERDFGILGCHLLIRSVPNGLARQLSPIPRPVDAESAIGVIDEQRPRTHLPILAGWHGA